MLWGAKVKITEDNMMDPHAHNMHEFVVCLNNTGKHLKRPICHQDNIVSILLRWECRCPC